MLFLKEKLRHPTMRALIISVILCGSLQVCLGCSCLPTDLESSYCISNNRYLMRASVTSDRIPVDDSEFSDFYFEITVTGQIEARVPLDGVNTSRVYTAHDGALCGVSLHQEQHLFIGSVYNDKLHIGLCDYIRVWKFYWKTLPPTKKQFIQNPTCAKAVAVEPTK